MDRHHPSQRPPERRFEHPPPPQPSGPPPPGANFGPPPFHPQTAQPPVQIPFSDPFHTKRDPFLPDRRDRSGSFTLGNGQGNGGRPWPPGAQGPPSAPSSGNEHPPPPPPPPPPSHHPQMQHPHHQQPPRQPQQLPPPPPPGHPLQAPPFDSSRRGSLGGQGSPPQFRRAPHESLPPPPSYPARNMLPPPSPPQIPPGSAQPPMMTSAPRDQRHPNSSPFASNREPAGPSSGQRPGMSISAMLGGGEDRRSMVNSSPHATNTAPSPTPRSSMRPPSPGRARSSSMREGYPRGFRPPSPGRASVFGEPRPASVALGHDRTISEPRREGAFGSPQMQRGSAHSFRAFQGPPHPLFDNHRREFVNVGPQGRPSSQPSEPPQQRGRLEELGPREQEMPQESRVGMFRHYGEHHNPAIQRDGPPRQEQHGIYTNGVARASQPPEHTIFRSPQMSQLGPESMQGQERMRGAPFGTPMREDQAGAFRPTYHHQHHIPHSVPEQQARMEYGPRNLDEIRREPHRSSPPRSDLYRPRNGVHERPMTFEEHQRNEAIMQQRKESDGSVARAILGVSPELDRKGRSSPLPQAVQGAQPRHVGPGDSQPGVRGEFGRMFSGLGSGVGSITPTAGHNGTTTPSRLSPAKQVETGDLVRTAVDQIEEGRGGARGGARGGSNKRNGRKIKEDEQDSRAGTPSAGARGNKRAKPNPHVHHHHHGPGMGVHHHHHHHHQQQQDGVEGVGSGGFSTIRFPSNPLAGSNSQTSNQTPGAVHRHHHHHVTPHAHGHPAAGPHVHHHHHAPRPLAAPIPAYRTPTTTIHSKALLDSVAHLPRKNLGSQLYSTVLTPAPTTTTPLDAKTKFSSKMKPIPVFTGRENCTYTVRVPREYLSGAPAPTTSTKTSRAELERPSPLEEICRRRALWGSEIYTDDSDPVCAAVHSGWLKGDFGVENNADLDAFDADSPTQPKLQADAEVEGPLELTTRPMTPVAVPKGWDLHVELLILPPLEAYAGSHVNHICSREWRGKGVGHDGMSFAVLGVRFVKEGEGTRCAGRTGKERKGRLRAEEERRREGAEGLMALISGGVGAGRPLGNGANGIAAVGVGA